MTTHRILAILRIALGLTALSACSSGTHAGDSVPGSPVLGTLGVRVAAPAAGVAPIDGNLILQPGFKGEVIANVPGARELAVAANGDLLVGTNSFRVMLVTNPDSSTAPGAVRTLITLPAGPADGIALGPYNTLYVGTNKAVWKVHYAAGDLTESNPQQIAAVRTGPVAPNSDGDVHITTSVAVLWNTVYVSVGSSCNACTEVDPGRAAILSMGLNGENPTVYAKHMRNAVAMTFNPRTYFLWAGGAGQDNLAVGHPYEYFDSITQHPAGSDWGWPNCEENNIAYTPGADCSKVILPHVVLPAYSTIIGATFYPLNPRGPYAFPASYHGSLFLAAHGSWHRDATGAARVGPQVDVVPMTDSGWDAKIPVDWANPMAQFTPFLTGFQIPGTAQYRGRPTGLAVGAGGSLLIADDKTGNIYRIRPQ